MFNNIQLKQDSKMRYSPTQKIESRKKIIKAARSVFANVGFDKATIDQIMSEAGMTRDGFNKHFPNKTALLIEVVRGGQVDLPEDIPCHIGDISFFSRRSNKKTKPNIFPSKNLISAIHCTLAI